MTTGVSLGAPPRRRGAGFQSRMPGGLPSGQEGFPQPIRREGGRDTGRASRAKARRQRGVQREQAAGRGRAPRVPGGTAGLPAGKRLSLVSGGGGPGGRRLCRGGRAGPDPSCRQKGLLEPQPRGRGRSRELQGAQEPGSPPGGAPKAAVRRQLGGRHLPGTLHRVQGLCSVRPGAASWFYSRSLQIRHDLREPLN